MSVLDQIKIALGLKPSPWMTEKRVREKFVEAFPAAVIPEGDDPPRCGTCGELLVYSPAGTWYCASLTCVEIVSDEELDKADDYFEGLDDLTDEQQRIHKLEVAVARLEQIVKRILT